MPRRVHFRGELLKNAQFRPEPILGRIVIDKVVVNDEVFLSPPVRSDTASFVSLLNEKEIYDNTLLIPFPYTEHDAEAFIRLADLRSKAYRRPLDWAIRTTAGRLIGMVSCHGASQFDSSREEVGYWIGKPYWNKGIMTSVLQTFVQLGFVTYGFERLELPIFCTNAASKRVAEKAGFHLHSSIPKAHIKDGRPIDVDLYLILKA